MIDIFATHVQTFIYWLLSSTFQASLVICLVLLAQRLLRHRLGVRARCLLWLVVLVRMALPWAPESRLSIYNLLPRAPLQGYKALMDPFAEGPTARFAVKDEIDAARPYHPAGTASAMHVQSRMGRGSTDRIVVCLMLFWLAGACFLTVWILAANMRILRVVRRIHPVADPEILDLLNDCRRQIGTRRPVRVIVTDQVNGPALFGLVRPCLLLPERILGDMDRNELRYILLHELAHLRRHDILLGMVASSLHVLHWFNPLIGYGFKRMQADRELACDGLALSRLGSNETSAYGHTVLRLTDQLFKSRLRLIPTGFLGGRARITQRVAMISRFTKETYRYSPLAIVLVGLLGYIGLTNRLSLDRIAQAQPGVIQPAESYALPEDSAAAHEYANVKRIHLRHLETGQYLTVSGNSVSCDAEPGETGLWEARYDDEFTPEGDMLIYSVSRGTFLSTDSQGNLALNQVAPDEWARWFRKAGPLGVQVISQELKNGYLRLDEQGQVKTVVFGRDLRSQWDMIQLDRDKDKKENINK
ncbi:MAG: M56 family metallopeptidase [Planctomycetota bacterium]